MGAACLGAAIVIQCKKYEWLIQCIVLLEEHLQLRIIHIFHALRHLGRYKVQVIVVLVLDMRQILIVEA